jgi:hypothetical protein
MEGCVTAMASVISFLHASVGGSASEEEDAFWIFLVLAESGVFYQDDLRTVRDLDAIDEALRQHAPAALRELLARHGTDGGSVDLHGADAAAGTVADAALVSAGCKSFVFKTLYQPLMSEAAACASRSSTTQQQRSSNGSSCDAGSASDFGLGLARLWDVIFLDGKAALRGCIVATLCAVAEPLLVQSAEPASVLQDRCREELARTVQNADALLLLSSSGGGDSGGGGGGGGREDKVALGADSAGDTRTNAWSHGGPSVREMISMHQQATAMTRETKSDAEMQQQESVHNNDQMGEKLPIDRGGRGEGQGVLGVGWLGSEEGEEQGAGGDDEIFLQLDFTLQSERQSEAAQLQRKHTHLRKIEQTALAERGGSLASLQVARQQEAQLQAARQAEVESTVREEAAAAAATHRKKCAVSAARALELELRGLRLLGTGRSRSRSRSITRGSPRSQRQRHQRHQQQCGRGSGATAMASRRSRRTSSAEDYTGSAR